MTLTAFTISEQRSFIRSVIGHVSAGSPMEIVGEEEEIDFNFMLSKGSSNSMAVRVEGESMCPEIQSGDWVVLAFDIEPRAGDIVIAKVAGGYTIKRLKLNDLKGRRGLFLVPSNGFIPTTEISDGDDFQILGVVISKATHFRQW